MQLTIALPDDITQTDSFNQTDWMREIAIAHYDVEEFEQDVQHLRDRGWL
jgi:predicted HTH domain antitoxin